MTSPLPSARVKGVSFISTRRFVEQSGPGAWSRVLAAMPEEHRKIADEALAIGWYPMDGYKSLLAAIDDRLGAKNLAIMSPLGRFQAEHDLNLFYRIVLRFWSPAILIEKTAEMWGRYHDTGTWAVTREGDHRVTAAVSGWLGSGDVVCAVIVAYIARLFELVGASSARVQHPECMARGGRRCQWIVEWK
jgi:predicted hydrocarbon binding protein